MRESNSLNHTFIVQKPVNTNAGKHSLTTPALHYITFSKVIHCIGLLIGKFESLILLQTELLTSQKYNNSSHWYLNLSAGPEAYTRNLRIQPGQPEQYPCGSCKPPYRYID